MAELVNPSIDFSPLSSLGQTYRTAQKDAREQSLQDAFKNGLPRSPNGQVDYKSLNDTLSYHGADIGSLLSVAKLDDAQRRSNAEMQASSDFRSSLNGMFGGAPAAQPAGTPAGMAQRAPVQPSSKSWGDQEAENVGLYEKPAAAQGGMKLGDLGKPAAVNAAFTPPAPAARSEFALGPQHAPALLQAMSDPRLPQTDREVAGKLFTRVLDAAKPDEKVQHLQELARVSGFTGTPLELEERLRRASKTDVTTNIDQKGETEEAKSAGKAAGERRAAMFGAANSATNNLATLTRVGTLLDQVDQGKLAPGRMNISAWSKSLGMNDDFAKGLGLDPSKVGTSQAVQAMTNELVLGKIGAGGLPANNFSDADRQFLTDTLPKIGNDPRANKILIEAARRVHQGSIQRALDYQTWKEDPASKSKSFEDFELSRAKQTSQMDRFGDLRKQAETLVPSGGGMSGEAGGIQWRVK